MLARIRNEWECRRIAKLVWDLPKGQLTGTDAQRVKSHVAACHGCREELRFAERAALAAEALGTRTPPSARGWEEIRGALDSAHPRTDSGRTRLGWALSAAAACTLAIALWPRGERSPAARPLEQERMAILAPVRSSGRETPPNIVAGQTVKRAVRSNSGDGSHGSHGQEHPPLRVARTGRLRGEAPAAPRRKTDESMTVRPPVVLISRSSELSAAVDEPSTLVAGTPPDAISSDGIVLVAGSAPAAEALSDPSVSVETSFSYEAGP
jgi:hypothetical protein